MSRTSHTQFAVAATVVASLVIAACAHESVSGLRPRGHFVTGDESKITVCKAASSPAGTYNFTVTDPVGNLHDDDVSVSSFSLTIPVGATEDVCTDIYVRTTADNELGDQFVTITASEDLAGGTTLGNITASGGGGCCEIIVPGPIVNLAGRSVTLSLNAFHGSTATFFNVAGRNCTYTQGWWKNKGAGLLPSGEFFDSGLTWLEVLNTSPKGDAYFILAHQYIAATQNIAAGASAPPEVLAAIDQATDYFEGTLSLTKTQLTALADTLDRYNNGIIGPGHCDD